MLCWFSSGRSLFNFPASRAILLNWCRKSILPMQWHGIRASFQIATIAGPALGGIVYAIFRDRIRCTQLPFSISIFADGNDHANQDSDRGSLPGTGKPENGVRRLPFHLGQESDSRFDLAGHVLPSYSRSGSRCCQSMRGKSCTPGPWGLGLLRKRSPEWAQPSWR